MGNFGSGTDLLSLVVLLLFLRLVGAISSKNA